MRPVAVERAHHEAEGEFPRLYLDSPFGAIITLVPSELVNRGCQFASSMMPIVDDPADQRPYLRLDFTDVNGKDHFLEKCASAWEHFEKGMRERGLWPDDHSGEEEGPDQADLHSGLH